MMTKVLLCISLFIVTHIYSQNSDADLKSISLSVIIPYNFEKLAPKTLSKIETKIQRIITRNGISGSGYSNEFLIYPEFEIYNESVVYAMQNMVVVEAKFSLYIQQFSTQKIYASYSKSLTGSGATKERAINHAISQISVSDTALNSFIISGKKKMLAFYDDNCDQIIKDADALIKTQRYIYAFLTLSTIPKEAKKCYKRVQEKNVHVFKSYQDQLCKEQISEAKGEASRKNYDDALIAISNIDPSSSCNEEVEFLLKNMPKKISLSHRNNWKRKKKSYNEDPIGHFDRMVAECLKKEDESLSAEKVKRENNAKKRL